jgi:hypothetical protein
MTRLGRGLAATSAAFTTGMLAIQLAMSIDQLGVPGALWRLAGFFTILTNLLVAIVAWAMVRRRRSWLGGPLMRLVTVNSIVLVGLIYVIALQGLMHPEGWRLLTDRGFHWISPLLFLLAWLAAPHGGLRWRDALLAVAWPLAYSAYALIRGAIDGFYPYWFLDPAAQTPAQFVASYAVLTAVFTAFGLGFVAIDRWLAGRRKQAFD